MKDTVDELLAVKLQVVSSYISCFKLNKMIFFIGQFRNDTWSTERLFTKKYTKKVVS